MTMQADRSYRWLFWCLALLGLVLDQATKYGVFAWLDNGNDTNSSAILPGAFWLDVRFSPQTETGEGLLATLRTLGHDRLPWVNSGALWGLGPSLNHVFAAISIGAALAIILWSFRAAARERFLCVALGLILGGTLGNFYDRIVFGGVRDFLHWHWPRQSWLEIDFPVFNIADCCLVLGAFLLLVQAFYLQPEEQARPVQAEPTAAPVEQSVAEVPSTN
ncbi:MAG: signal peptidase II [Gemmataceae bacterium]|nr:signal peptidase II [Gemmataceae bacterium]